MGAITPEHDDGAGVELSEREYTSVYGAHLWKEAMGELGGMGALFGGG